MTQLSGGEIDLLGSYGLGKNAEVGFIVPGLFQSLRFQNTTGPDSTLNEQDVGDLQLYGKFKHSVAEHCAIGGGVELDLPNGPKNKGFTTGETGVTPFVSTRYQRGPYALGVNAGYEMYSGSPPDVFHYGSEVIVRVSENWAFRTELAGRVFKDGGPFVRRAAAAAGHRLQSVAEPDGPPAGHGRTHQLGDRLGCRRRPGVHLSRAVICRGGSAAGPRRRRP